MRNHSLEITNNLRSCGRRGCKEDKGKDGSDGERRENRKKKTNVRGKGENYSLIPIGEKYIRRSNRRKKEIMKGKKRLWVTKDCLAKAGPGEHHLVWKERCRMIRGSQEKRDSKREGGGRILSIDDPFVA